MTRKTTRRLRNLRRQFQTGSITLVEYRKALIKLQQNPR